MTLAGKSTVDEIRKRFDHDVERFSRLETGQQATIDAPLVLDLVASVANGHLKPGDRLLDLGCGAGNFTLRLLLEIGPLECHLADLSLPMLERAQQRTAGLASRQPSIYQSDLRDLHFEENTFDIILAGAVLHHLRDETDWTDTFAKLHRWLKPGGRLYVSDLAVFDDGAVHGIMWNRYGDYLETLGGTSYRENVFSYIEKEDSPRSLPFQIALLRNTGFRSYDILHRNSVFACYYASK